MEAEGVNRLSGSLPRRSGLWCNHQAQARVTEVYALPPGHVTRDGLACAPQSLLIHPGCNSSARTNTAQEASWRSATAGEIRSCSIYDRTLNYQRKHPNRTDVAYCARLHTAGEAQLRPPTLALWKPFAGPSPLVRVNPSVASRPRGRGSRP